MAQPLLLSAVILTLCAATLGFLDPHPSLDSAVSGESRGNQRSQRQVPGTREREKDPKYKPAPSRFRHGDLDFLTEVREDYYSTVDKKRDEINAKIVEASQFIKDNNDTLLWFQVHSMTFHEITEMNKRTRINALYAKSTTLVRDAIGSLNRAGDLLGRARLNEKAVVSSPGFIKTTYGLGLHYLIAMDDVLTAEDAVNSAKSLFNEALQLAVHKH